jgi:hypothetical protein
VDKNKGRFLSALIKFQRRLMAKFLNLIGQKFGRLTVLSQKGKNRWGKSLWECKCDCGNIVIVVGGGLKSKSTQSCGCLRKDMYFLAMKKYNTYDLSGDYGKCFLSEQKYFLFDKEDFEKINFFYWYLTNANYVITYNPRTKKYILFSRFISNASPNEIVDHENRNPLDNRKSNLRITDATGNSINRSISSNNTSGIIGVSWSKTKNKWRSFVSVQKKFIHLGYFKNFEDAVKARLVAENLYYGDFAPQRHLYEKYGI